MAAQDLTRKKQDMMSEGVQLARRLLMAVEDAETWVDTLQADAFHQGGANAITQDDISGEGIIHLTPTLVQQLRSSCNTLTAALTAAQRNNLRQVARGVLKSG